MQLQTLNYSQYEGSINEWSLRDLTFGPINLIVGLNASGKTRTLNVIKGLSILLSQAELGWKEGDYDVFFTDHGKTIAYQLQYTSGAVVHEKLKINSDVCMERTKGGSGEIHAEQLKVIIPFQTPPDQVAAFSRRDSVQHPFLEVLYQWASNLVRYDFGTPMGKDTILISSAVAANDKIDFRETKRATAIFQRGLRDFGDSFVGLVKSDMAAIGYAIERVWIGQPESIEFGELPGQPMAICVKEASLPAPVSQVEISQGMFRALSLIIQLNYAYLAGHPSCILIDDIGEGLDFDRSSALIRLLIDKAKGSSAQLIMTSNDRFIMNNLPLEYWVILHREGGTIRNFSYRNSKQMFDEFALTGLSNFDLFSGGYFLKQENEG